MKILILGSSGLVGSRFVELYPEKEELLAPTHSELYLTDLAKVKEFISRSRPDTIINFAAYTNVSEAEDQRDNKKGDCWQINVEGVRNLVVAINPTKTRLVQISTDHVFSGMADDPGPYPESQTPETNSAKLTWYGFTKAEAERLIRQMIGQNAVILRIIYPVRALFPKNSTILGSRSNFTMREDSIPYSPTSRFQSLVLMRLVWRCKR